MRTRVTALSETCVLLVSMCRPSVKMPGKCSFNRLWLDKEPYKQWLREDPGGNMHKAFCHVCKRDIDISSMGESALSSHCKGKKHTELMKVLSATVPVSSLFSSNSKSMSDQTSSPSATSSNTVPTPCVSVESLSSTKTEAMKAEVLWTLKVVTSHYSFKSCEGNSVLFQRMFSDSAVARQFSCGERKTAYLAAFGIGPYLQSSLKLRLKKESAYVLLFDETLNSQLQKKQMDVHVRFWDNDTIHTHFFKSEFMGHAAASDICDRLEPIIEELGYSKLIQLSMDGPNVNWKVFNSLQEQVERHTAGRTMLQTGSCGLHTLHNAFRAGCVATDWDMEGFLSSLFILFHDSPARREDFVTITGSSIFSLKFCKHRYTMLFILLSLHFFLFATSHDITAIRRIR